MSQSRKTYVLLAFGEPIARLGLRFLLQKAPGLCVCAEADSAPAARELFERHRPQLALVDHWLPQGDAAELVRDWKRSQPTTKTMMIGPAADLGAIEAAFRAGARGYVARTEEGTEILRAIEQVLAGRLFTSADAEQALLAALAVPRSSGSKRRLDGLSARERQVFDWIGRGLGPSDIAERLHRSVKTIETHRERIKVKLKLPTAAALKQHAVRWHLQRAACAG